MAILNPTVKASSAILTLDPENGSQTLPDNIQAEFTAEKRIENKVLTIPATSGSVTITAATEGFTATDLVKIEVLTVGKPATIKVNGAATGFTIKPINSTGKAYFTGSIEFTTITIENADAAEIDISLSVFEKQA